MNITKDQNTDFVEQVSRESGQNPYLCYQCGNCTAGCPFTEFFDYPVGQIMRLLQVGQKETILRSRAIWLCATCETCTTRCPCQIDVAQIMDTLRVIARRENYVSEKDIKLFFDTFLDSLRKYGRVFELGILLNYNLKSGKIFADIDLGPKVLGKGKIHFLPTKIKGKEKIERIFGRFLERAKKDE